uniref:Brix domain-containing protein n=1 Tax=Oryza rufipogon TaxID=4529 RepID=A0A0E0PT81_ORYRU
MAKERKRRQPADAPPPGDDDEGRDHRREKKPRKERPDPVLPSQIKNKDKRKEVHAKLKREKKAQKRQLARERGQAAQRAPPEKLVPRTIENTREPDETVCRPDDQELFAGNDADEFNAVLKQQTTPKVLITTCRFNSGRGPAFIEELMQVIPNSCYVKRGTYELKKIVEYANNRDFTSLVVVHTNRREPDALLIINLPAGPTAHFKLSKLILRKDIKNHGNPTSHKPELVLNNFTTRLGHRVGRMIQSLFPQEPNFRGRRVVTFHNQRDYIFFRHHRYIFEMKENKIASKDKKAKTSESKSQPEKQVICRLQECGPRFTLKLLTLQHGTFDTKNGEYEWVHKPDMDTSRRRFFFPNMSCYPQDVSSNLLPYKGRYHPTAMGLHLIVPALLSIQELIIAGPMFFKAAIATSGAMTAPGSSYPRGWLADSCLLLGTAATHGLGVPSYPSKAICFCAYVRAGQGVGWSRVQQCSGTWLAPSPGPAMLSAPVWSNG